MRNKKNISKLLAVPALLACASIFFLACKNGVVKNDAELLFEENPVTIKWTGVETAVVESFQANVQVHSMNNRTDTYAELRETYRLSVKTIGDRILTRIDFPADEEMGITARSLLSDGKVFLMLDTASERVLERLTVKDEVAPSLKFLAPETALSRINLSLIRKEAKRLALDMSEDSKKGLLVLNLPPNLLSKNQYEKLISSRVRFDMNNETLNEVETVHLQEDGTKVTTKTIILYEEKDGVPIKIGSVTEIDSQNPNKITGISEDVPVYESEEDIPEISQEELAELEKEGVVSEKIDMLFGDPGDLSYNETVIELYQDVEINAVSDRLFRLILED